MSQRNNEICALYAKGLSGYQLAEVFGVTRSRIYQILHKYGAAVKPIGPTYSGDMSLVALSPLAPLHQFAGPQPSLHCQHADGGSPDLPSAPSSISSQRDRLQSKAV